jgi:hypothetical protein
VQAMFDEADALPECAAQSAILERIAARCESLGDLHSAWNVRCRILGSKASYHDLKFENIFMNLAWCLAVSDADPVEFSPSPVLWQYKWVATSAPDYAAVSRDVLERIVTDLDERFIRAGWGRRAGLMKRMELYQTLGEYDRAMEVAREWRAVPRDRGADCPACEANTYASLLFDTGDAEQAIVCRKEGEKFSFHHGSIDDKDIQQRIVTVMEGGEDAFRRRKEIYQLWKSSN